MRGRKGRSSWNGTLPVADSPLEARRMGADHTGAAPPPSQCVMTAESRSLQN